MDQYTTRRISSHGNLSIEGERVYFTIEYAPATKGLFTVIFGEASKFENFEVIVHEGRVLDVNAKYANMTCQIELLKAISDLLRAEKLIE